MPGRFDSGKGRTHRGQCPGRNVIIAGSITGNVEAQGKIHIEASGTLIGNAEMKTFIVDEGATFKGESKMKGEKGEEKKKSEQQMEKKKTS